MAGFGVLIVSGILSAIFLFFIAVFAAAAGVYHGQLCAGGLFHRLHGAKKRATHIHSLPGFPFTASICWESWQTGGSWAPCRPF